MAEAGIGQELLADGHQRAAFPRGRHVALGIDRHPRRRCIPQLERQDVIVVTSTVRST